MISLFKRVTVFVLLLLSLLLVVSHAGFAQDAILTNITVSNTRDDLLLYLNLEGDKSKSVTVPDGDNLAIADADMKLKSWIWTLAGAYSIWQQDKSHLDLFAGARLLALDTDLELSGAELRQKTHKLSASEDIWTGIIGAKGRIGLNDRWFLPYSIDVGAGSSTTTWQALGGVGYSFNWGDIVLNYRYLEYDQDGNKPVQNLSFGGPELGVVFRW